jgi:hypothetical protein
MNFMLTGPCKYQGKVYETELHWKDEVDRVLREVSRTDKSRGQTPL